MAPSRSALIALPVFKLLNTIFDTIFDTDSTDDEIEMILLAVLKLTKNEVKL